MAEIRMTWQVRGILKLYDSYTKKPALTAGIQVVTDQGISVVRKPGGILVLAENRMFTEKERLTVILKSPVFLTEQLSLPLREEPEIRVVRLNPGKGYPAAAGSSRIYGTAAPGTGISFVFTGVSSSMRLLGDGESGAKELTVYHPGLQSLEGTVLELESGGKRERIRLGKCTDDSRPGTGVYRTEEPLTGNYPKMDAILRPVQETRAVEDGTYLLLFKSLPGTGGRLSFQGPEGGAVMEQEMELKEGGSVRRDLPIPV